MPLYPIENGASPAIDEYTWLTFYAPYAYIICPIRRRVKNNLRTLCVYYGVLFYAVEWGQAGSMTNNLGPDRVVTNNQQLTTNNYIAWCGRGDLNSYDPKAA